MNEFKVFNYGKTPVRAVDKNGAPWWVLADVCRVLELSNPTMVASRLDDDERAKFDLGRQGNGTIINESGLYKVILRSDKPEAKKFTRWVTHEVLPAIRRSGRYETAQPKTEHTDSQVRSTCFGTLDGVPVLTTTEAAERFHVTTKAIRVIIRDYASRDFKDGEDYVFGAKFTAKYKKQNPERRVSRTYFIFSSGIAKLETRFRQTMGFDGTAPALEKSERLPAHVEVKTSAVAKGDDLAGIWTQVESLCGHGRFIKN